MVDVVVVAGSQSASESYWPAGTAAASFGPATDMKMPARGRGADMLTLHVMLSSLRNDQKSVDALWDNALQGASQLTEHDCSTYK